jgi:ubiquinone/menaquinone biosynthesis C-methylase UbiE
VDHAQLVELIRHGVEPGAARWADLGAGTGNFTLALAELLGPGAHITAVDRDRGSLRQLEHRLTGQPQAGIELLLSDFTSPLDLRGLDGVLMANSLHFVRDKGPVLTRVRGMLRDGGVLLMVEYDSDRGNPWVPHPMSYETWVRVADGAGFSGTRRIGWLPSRHLGGMYAAASRAPAAAGPSSTGYPRTE